MKTAVFQKRECAISRGLPNASNACYVDSAPQTSGNPNTPREAESIMLATINNRSLRRIAQQGEARCVVAAAFSSSTSSTAASRCSSAQRDAATP